jgi:hypothetical protein
VSEASAVQGLPGDSPHKQASSGQLLVAMSLTLSSKLVGPPVPLRKTKHPPQSAHHWQGSQSRVNFKTPNQPHQLPRGLYVHTQ